MPTAPENVARRRVQQSHQLEHLHRRRDAANLLQAKRQDFDKLPSRGVGISRDENASAFRHLLHSTCEMDIYAGRVISLIDTILDNLNDNLAGVETDSDL